MKPAVNHKTIVDLRQKCLSVTTMLLPQIMFKMLNSNASQLLSNFQQSLLEK